MKKYQIIYADPPWAYSTSQHNGAGGTSTGGAHTHYPTATDEEICKMSVSDIADDNCLLFMWATGPKLDIAFKVGSAWGFQYCTVGFVWQKDRDNPGTYTMSSCEYVLIFKKGTIPHPRGSRNTKQFYSSERMEHSRKPEEIRKRIHEMFPKQTKIELFARARTPNLFGWDEYDGWDVFGNMIESDVDIKQEIIKL